MENDECGFWNLLLEFVLCLPACAPEASPRSQVRTHIKFNLDPNGAPRSPLRVGGAMAGVQCIGKVWNVVGGVRKTRSESSPTHRPLAM